jgi:TetR/AcrR family transcriptional regulator
VNHNTWQRARTETQVRARVDQILDAAAELFRTHEFTDVTMGKIAQAAGFTRSNLYRYFTSLEEIFLTMYVDDAQAWAEAVAGEFRARMDNASFVERWVGLLTRHRRLTELTPLLAPVLERHSSPETYEKAKRAIAGVAGPVAAAVRIALPDLSEAEAFSLLRFSQVFMAGAWPMSRRSDWQDETLNRLQLHSMKIDFVDVMTEALTVFLCGLQGGGGAPPVAAGRSESGAREADAE